MGIEVDPDGLRSGANRAAASADAFAAPAGVTGSGDGPDHRGIAAFRAAMDAVSKDAARFLSWQSEAWHRGATGFEDTAHNSKDRFDGLMP